MGKINVDLYDKIVMKKREKKKNMEIEGIYT